MMQQLHRRPRPAGRMHQSPPTSAPGTTAMLPKQARPGLCQVVLVHRSRWEEREGHEVQEFVSFLDPFYSMAHLDSSWVKMSEVSDVPTS